MAVGFAIADKVSSLIDAAMLGGQVPLDKMNAALACVSNKHLFNKYKLSTISTIH